MARDDRGWRHNGCMRKTDDLDTLPSGEHTKSY